MRLTRVAGHNYRSFTDFDIDLSAVRGGVLSSGPTGSGKSSMIDCLTWVCYGRTRSRRANGFVKIGKDEAWGLVEWLANDRTTYRARRTVSLKTARPKPDLQFACLNGGGTWTPLTGKSIPETEAKIEQVIGQDYDTITSGNFALQGESAKFSRASVSDRIAVLSQMLKLSVYQEWQEAAGREARALDQQASTLEAQVAVADAELATRSEIEAALHQEAHTATTCRMQADVTQGEIDQASQQLATLQASIEPTRARLEAFAMDRETLSRREKAHGEKRNRVEHWQSILARRAEIETAATRLTALEAKLKAKEVALAGIGAEGKSLVEQVKAAEQRAAETDQAVKTANAKLSEARQRVARRGELEQRVGRLTAAQRERKEGADRIRVADEAITSHRTTLDAIKAANQETTKRRGEILAEEKTINAETAGLDPLIAGHEKRIGDMGSVPCLKVGDLATRCPLLQDVRDSIVPLKSLREQHARLCAWVRPALPELRPSAELEALLAGLDKEKSAEDRKRVALDAEIAALQPAEAELASLDTIAAGIPTLEEEARAAVLADTEAVRARNVLRSAVEAAKSRYIDLQAEIKPLEAERTTLQSTAALLSDAGHAERELPGLEAEVAALDAEITALQERLATEADVRSSLATHSAAIATHSAAIATWRQELADLRRRAQAAIDAAATARAELASLDTLAGERAKAAEEAANLRRRHTTLLALELFYKQAPLMILENEAIPTIEEEANRVLARISQSGMRLQLRTQREVKSRDALADGLDIIITDQMGEREYEAYSGGQQFQIDLALRVALAKLQARRAGASVETLVIDEGMGTQSSECLDAIMAALRAIQNDFPLLWVITHVEVLKDAFPARVEVSGGPVDSHAELVLA